MSAGTLTLTNNSAAVTGAGTPFNTELAAGDFIVVTVGGVPYTLPVKSVESATSLTLVSVYTGPTQSGAAWFAVPRVAMNLVTAALVAQSAEALRGLNYDKQNWQQVFSGTGTITVRLPDGTTYTGPAWNGITTAIENKADKTALNDYAKKGANNDITSIAGLTTALTVAQGGTGGKTQADARKGIGCGTAAEKDTGTDVGKVMLVGDTIGKYKTTPTYGGSNITPASGLIAEASINTNVAVKVVGIRCANAAGGWVLWDSMGSFQDATTDPNAHAMLFTSTDGGSYTRNWFMYNDGRLVGPSGTFVPGTSDIRFKDDVKPIDVDDAISFVKQLKAVTYRYKMSHEFYSGYIAQDIHELKPELINFTERLNINGEDIEGVMNLSAGNIAAGYLTPVVQYLLEKVEKLEMKIQEITNQGS